MPDIIDRHADTLETSLYRLFRIVNARTAASIVAALVTVEMSPHVYRAAALAEMVDAIAASRADDVARIDDTDQLALFDLEPVS